ncbi:hypothetical protein ANCCEY_15906, partial [Ancylostoma ceylanicum]
HPNEASIRLVRWLWIPIRYGLLQPIHIRHLSECVRWLRWLWRLRWLWHVQWLGIWIVWEV